AVPPASNSASRRMPWLARRDGGQRSAAGDRADGTSSLRRGETCPHERARSRRHRSRGPRWPHVRRRHVPRRWRGRCRRGGAVGVDGGAVDAGRLVAQGSGALTLRRARTTAGAAEAFTATLTIDGGRIEVDQLNARDDGHVVTNGADVRVGRVEATRSAIELL